MGSCHESTKPRPVDSLSKQVRLIFEAIAENCSSPEVDR
jgi:hypothetical protein